jgi:Tol biopolymer transport system component
MSPSRRRCLSTGPPGVDIAFSSFVASTRYGRLRLSPDGSRLAIEVADASQSNTHVWVGDVSGTRLSQLTLDPGEHQYPVWTQDGRRVIFQSSRDGGSLRWQPAGGAGADELLARTLGAPYFVTPPDGRSLVFLRRTGDTFPLFALSLDAARREEKLELIPGSVAAVSRDGRWLANSSAETGDFEIYVQPYPNPTGARWKITTGGGRDPAWSRDGRELFYQSDTTMFAVPVTTEPAVAFGRAIALFDGPYFDSTGRYFDVAPDGRFLMIKPGWLSARQDAPLHLVLNWTEELTRLVPTR